MKVLVIQPGADRRGHFGHSTVNTCQALAKYGHEVTLWTNKVCTEKYLQEPALFKIVQVEDGRLSFDRYDGAGKVNVSQFTRGYLRNSYAVLKSALKAAQKEKFDVIHATGIEFLTATLLLKRYSGHIPPVVIEISAANFSFKTYAGPVPLRCYKVFQRELFKTTLGKELKGIAVLGEYHRDALRKQLGVSEDFPIHVIPDGGSVPTFRLDAREARLRLGLGDYGGTIFLFFGLLRKEKGIEDLFQAVSILNGRDFRVLVAGAPFDYTEKQIEDLVAVNRIADKVLMRLAYVPEDQVPLYFYASDTLVLPYRRIYTGGSGPLLKGAAMHGRPSIVTDISEMGKLTRSNHMGTVAEPENPKSLARKMQEFIEMSAADRHQMAENAFAVAKQNTWDAMAVKFNDLYQLALQ